MKRIKVTYRGSDRWPDGTLIPRGSTYVDSLGNQWVEFPTFKVGVYANLEGREMNITDVRWSVHKERKP